MSLTEWLLAPLDWLAKQQEQQEKALPADRHDIFRVLEQGSRVEELHEKLDVLIKKVEAFQPYIDLVTTLPKPEADAYRGRHVDLGPYFVWSSCLIHPTHHSDTTIRLFSYARGATGPGFAYASSPAETNLVVAGGIVGFLALADRSTAVHQALVHVEGDPEDVRNFFGSAVIELETDMLVHAVPPLIFAREIGENLRIVATPLIDLQPVPPRSTPKPIAVRLRLPVAPGAPLRVRIGLSLREP